MTKVMYCNKCGDHIGRDGTRKRVWDAECHRFIQEHGRKNVEALVQVDHSKKMEWIVVGEARRVYQ